MHQEAEFGVASHVFYKPPLVSDVQNNKKPSMFSTLVPTLFQPFSRREAEVDKNLEDSVSTPHNQKIPRWISQIGQTYNPDSENPTSDFVEDAESDFFSNRIFVFTPIGDVVDLPVGATPIDFSYAIHSEIGNHTFGAKVNRKLVQLDTVLKNGDIVEIETRKSAKPSPKWLHFAKTSLARKHIRAATEEKI
jgi:(p)ppGpp synthase/HD superfamily hydrolase